MFSVYSTTVVYKNTIYRFYFNASSNLWIQLNSTAPMEMYESGCGALPNENILVIGSGYVGSTTSFAV